MKVLAEQWSPSYTKPDCGLFFLHRFLNFILFGGLTPAMSRHMHKVVAKTELLRATTTQTTRRQPITHHARGLSYAPWATEECTSVHSSELVRGGKYCGVHVKDF